MRRISEVAVDRVLVRVGTERIGVNRRRGRAAMAAATTTYTGYIIG
jgi:hypothetical protein